MNETDSSAIIGVQPAAQPLRVAVLGAGAGGAAACVELTLAGHAVVLWNRSAQALMPFIATGCVQYEGVLGLGEARPVLITDKIDTAVRGADLILVCLPTLSHAPIARALATIGSRVPVVLNPGHTGGALEFAHSYRATATSLGGDPVPPPIAEFNTLTYVCRKYHPARVTITGRAQALRAAALPGGEVALALGQSIYDCAQAVPDVLYTSLANLNMTLHSPCAILGAAWIEATQGDFTFYVQGMTSGVARVMAALDAERLAVGRAFGHELLGVAAEMQRVGTVDASVTDTSDLAVAIASGEANKKIRAPDSLTHRYYREDFGHGLVPFIALARAAGIATPVAESLLRLGETLTGEPFSQRGRTAASMGIEGMGLEALRARVTTG